MSENGTFSISLAAVQDEAIQSWTDEKRADFCDTFAKEADAASAVCVLVAERIIDAAMRRHFVPQNREWARRLRTGKVTDVQTYQVRGGRSYEELSEIATQQAKTIIDELPRSIDAVKLIDAPTASKMKELEGIETELTRLLAEFNELPDVIDVDDVPGDWTVNQFRQHLTEQVEKRDSIKRKGTRLGEKASKLEEAISKRLYKGLPGLKEAVAKVVKAHYERASYLKTLTRQVTEKIKFGDSPAALVLLSTFRENEVTVSDNIKAEFTAALAKLAAGSKNDGAE